MGRESLTEAENGTEEAVAKTKTELTEAQQEKLKRIPRHLRGQYREACGGRSRKVAIHAFCVECMGYERSEVERCTAPGCPLYPYRPGSTVPTGLTEEERQARGQALLRARESKRTNNERPKG